jgi:hypothetical protein
MTKIYKVYSETLGLLDEDYGTREDAQQKAQEVAKDEEAGFVSVLELKDKYARRKDITERVKTFEDAMKVVGEDAKEFEKICERLSPDEIAYKKLKIIAEALNEGWDWKGIDENQERWFPWFYRKIENGKACGLLCASTENVPSARVVTIGSRLFVKTDELARYFGEQFIELWREYYLG